MSQDRPAHINAILDKWANRGDVGAREAAAEQPERRIQATGRSEQCRSCTNSMTVMYIEGARDPDAPHQCWKCLRDKVAAPPEGARPGFLTLSRPERVGEE